jgi:sensor histidine kinase YesM
MTGSPRYWLRILLANVIGAFAVAGISGPGLASRSFLRTLGISLVFANSIGTLLGLAMPLVAGWCWSSGKAGGERLIIRWTSLIATIVVLTAAGTVVATAILYAFGTFPARLFWKWSIDGFEVGFVISLILCVGITTYETLRQQLEDATVALRIKERDEAEAKRLAAEAQLASLESRVQPHFLFNTLNSIASLIPTDPAGAERMTGQLASLLRSSLDQQTTPLVPLDEELKVVRDYLDIQRVRFGNRLRYDIRVEGEAGSVGVPRLSVQTLVENSVKHAVSIRRDGASMAIHAAVANSVLRITVIDDGPGFDAAVLPPGHGLALLRGRLAMLFGERASLAIESAPGRTSVAVDVPALLSQDDRNQ